MGLLVFYVVLALSVSFLCSIMEAVLLSVTPAYVAVLEKNNHAAASGLRRLKDNIDRPLAAILSLNTIAHTVGATGAGAQAALVFGDTYVGVISAVLTLLILVISEVIPKTVGAVHWRRLAPLLTRVLIPVIWLMWPFVKLSKVITRLLSRKEDDASVSREELAAMAELGAQQGVFQADESRILKNLFRFGSLQVRDVMTPRIVLFALPEESEIHDVVQEYDEFRFSRIPVYAESRDDITGYVLKDEMLLRAAQDENGGTLGALKREMLVVPDALPLPELFERMLDSLEHIALVVDEYGGTAGLVTMEDVVETLLGLEIVDEVDSVRDMQVLARQQWVERARRLGLLTDELEAAAHAEREAILRYGLTGELARGADRDESRD